jgi:hypothetical protein|nr:MAG TPA_asm: hypothetical protein [Caudoviricetes sp.]
MWIRTQNNYILANVNSLRICKCDIDGCVYYSIHGHYDRYEQELGEYSTKEKAMEVLNDIYFRIKYADIDEVLVYEMPKDEDVEV